MALQIIWTQDAKTHLNEILEYWVQRNGTVTYSQKLYQNIKNALKTLSKYPESGKLTENSLVRAKIVKEYYLFYTFESEYIFVIGFCHMSRDPNYVKSLIK